jgi:hypothetical protein
MLRGYAHCGIVAAGLLFFVPFAAWAGQPAGGAAAKEACAGEAGYRASWLDRTHAYLTSKICEPAVWFDNFFGDERADEENQASTYVRLKVGMRWRDEQGWDVPTETYASIKLPKATDRLRLIFLGQSDDDVRDDPSEPGFIGEGEDKAQVGLRYEALARPRSNLSFTATTSPKAEARYRYTYPFNDRDLGRFTQTAFWSDADGWGGLTRGDFERRYQNSNLLRFTAWGKACDECDDVEWRTELAYFHAVSSRAAMEYKAYAYGNTRDGHVDDYVLRTKYRRNFYRPWLFWEIQPELRWPWRADVDREVEPRVTVFLEIQFAAGMGYAYR